jgi:hypothetical protein
MQMVPDEVAECPPLTEVGALFEEHIAVVRSGLRVANSFSAMRDFETKVSSLNGVESLRFEPLVNPLYVAAGLVRIRLSSGERSHIAGHWSVQRDGTATIDFIEIPVISVLGSRLSFELSKVRSDGRLKRIIGGLAASVRQDHRLDLVGGLDKPE